MYRVGTDKYYGHPNPQPQASSSYNGGNPTSGFDPIEITEYPVGVDPPIELPRQPVYNFGLNRSPNGIIEYKANAFGGG